MNRRKLIISNYWTKCILILMTHCVSLIYLPFSRATSFDSQVTIDGLFNNADAICLVKVEKIKSFPVPLRKNEQIMFGGNHTEAISSEITFKITQNLKNIISQEITISQLGGCVLDECFHVSSNPKFRAGEEVVLFLKNDASQNLQILFGEFGVIRAGNSNLKNSFSSVEALKNKIKKINKIKSR